MAAKADGQIWMKGRPACGLGSVVAVTNARNRLLPTKKVCALPDVGTMASLPPRHVYGVPFRPGRNAPVDDDEPGLYETRTAHNKP